MRAPVCFVALLALPPSPSPAQAVKQSATEIVETRVERIEPGSIRAEGGSCYTAVLHQGRPGDRAPAAGSDCILMEDGKPLGPAAHAVHEDIRTKGRGAYSHWTADLLYFSASDNGDPRKNGRAYTLVGRFRGLRQTAVVSLTAPSGSYRIRSAGADAVNRRLTLRNPDHRVAVSPRIRERGSPDLGSKEAMIGSIIEPGMTPERKSIAIWTFLMDRSYHYWPARGDAELHDPVKFLNVYGYGLCDDAAENFAALCEAAGLRARVWELNGHVVAESFYDGSWHMFDPDMQCYFRGAGGRVLGVEELAKDPAAITAAPATPSGYPSAEVARFYATTSDNGVHPPREARPGHRIEPVLQPGDEVTFDFAPARLVHNVFAPAEPLPPRAANGTLTRPGELRCRGGRVPDPRRVALRPPGRRAGHHRGHGAGRRDRRRRRGLDDAPDPVRRHRAEAGPDALVHRPKGCALRRCAPRPRCIRGGEADLAIPVLRRAALPAVRPGTTTFDITLSPAAGAFPADWKGLEVTHEWDEPRRAAR